MNVIVCLSVACCVFGFTAGQINQNSAQGNQAWVYTYDDEAGEEPSAFETSTVDVDIDGNDAKPSEQPLDSGGYTYTYVEEEEDQDPTAAAEEEEEEAPKEEEVVEEEEIEEDVEPEAEDEEEDGNNTSIPLPSMAELKQMILKKQVTADYLNGFEKDLISLVCTCRGQFNDGDMFNLAQVFRGKETPKETCDRVCSDIHGSSKQQKTRFKRQLSAPYGGWNAYPNFGFGSFFGGFPVGYGALGFNLMGAWAGLGGANYGCVAGGCGGAGGCHFGCSRAWLPAPAIPARTIVRTVNVPRPVPVPVAKPVPVPVARPVDVPMPRHVDIPVPRTVLVPRPVDVPVHRAVDVPVVRQITVARQVPVPYPVVKPITVAVAKPYAVAVPKPVAVAVAQPDSAVAVPIRRRLIVQKRYLYRPAVARVSGVALVPVRGVAMSGGAAGGRNAILNTAGYGGRGLTGYISGYGSNYGSSVPVPGPGITSAGGGYYTSSG